MEDYNRFNKSIVIKTITVTFLLIIIIGSFYNIRHMNYTKDPILMDFVKSKDDRATNIIGVSGEIDSLEIEYKYKIFDHAEIDTIDPININQISNTELQESLIKSLNEIQYGDLYYFLIIVSILLILMIILVW